MKDKVILIGFFILCFSTSRAQSLRFGAESGVSVALGKFSYISYLNVTSKGLHFGARFGAPLQYQFANSGAIHSGLFYTMKGINRKDSKTMYTMGLAYNSIELPLTLVYTSNNQENANHFFIGGGAYLGCVISGKVQTLDINGQEISKKVTFGNTILENDLRRLDYGLQFQTGVTFQNGLLFRFVAQRQLNDLAIKNNNRGFNNFGLTQIKNQAYIGLTMAYLFNL